MSEYDYRCPDHGTVTVRKPMSEAMDPEYCPRCERLMEKLFMPVNSRVKGGTPGYHRPR